MKITYISGPISNMPGLNKPAFFAAEESIRAAGNIAVNPMRNGLPDEAEWRQHMKADIKMMKVCNSILMLQGWKESRGAKIEHWLAKRRNFTVEYA